MTKALSGSATFLALQARVTAAETLTSNYASSTLTIPSVVASSSITTTGYMRTTSILVDTVGDASGGVRVAQASVDGHVGIVEFRKTDATRNSYIGFNLDANALEFGSDTGSGYKFTGANSQITVGDANFSIGIPATNPRITFDTSDYYSYDITNNIHNFVIAGSYALQLTSTVVSIFGEGYFTLGLSSSNPRITVDNGDYIEYDRSGNAHKLVVASAVVGTFNGSGLTTTNITATGTSGILIPNDTVTKGGVSLLPGTAGTTGKIVFSDAAGSQHSIVVGSNTGALSFGSTYGQGFSFTGGTTVIGSGLRLTLAGVPTYADNAAATTGGLVAGDVYRTATGVLMVRY